MSEPRTYINATCKVGQRDECGRDATYLIAVTEVADNGWAKEGRPGGVIGLCDFHASTPATRWCEDDDKTGADS